MHRLSPPRLTCDSIWNYLLIGSLVLVTSLPALAQSRGYRPPRGGSAPSSRGMGGARSGSCTAATSAPFTALAPLSHIGQTTATHPTVALYVPDSQPLAVDFRIYRYESSGKLQPQPIYQSELSSQPGIMTITLPQSEPSLTVGQHYYWQAALICDPNHGSEDLIVGAEMQIVESSQPETERWYDLLQGASPAELTSLLQGLATLEQSSGDAATQRHGQRLKQVVEAKS